MAKPTTIYLFNTAHTNAVVTTSGHQTNGLVTNEIWAAQEAGYTIGSHSDWIDWLVKNVAAVSRVRMLSLRAATNWVETSSLAGNPDLIGITSSGAGSAYIDLDIPVGYKLAALTLNAFGNSSANLTLAVQTVTVATAGAVTQASLTLAAISGVAADYAMNFLNPGLNLTVTVAAGAATFTRSTGSFITDGFAVGNAVTWSGFVNGGNNATKTISVLTATVMTVSSGTGLVNETSGAGAASATGGFSFPTIDSTIGGSQLKLTASATGLGASKLRYTIIPQ